MLNTLDYIQLTNQHLHNSPKTLFCTIITPSIMFYTVSYLSKLTTHTILDLGLIIFNLALSMTTVILFIECYLRLRTILTFLIHCKFSYFIFSVIYMFWCGITSFYYTKVYMYGITISISEYYVKMTIGHCPIVSGTGSPRLSWIKRPTIVVVVAFKCTLWDSVLHAPGFST